MKRSTERLLQNVTAAAGSLVGLLTIQGAGCLALAVLRADAIGATALQGAFASTALLAVAVTARQQIRQGPALAAAMVAGVLAVEILLWSVLVGVPTLPLVLQISLTVLVYGGLSSMALAAAFTCCVLARADLPAEAVARVTRRRRPARRARRAA
jgi:hypothetical protein